MGGLRAEFAAGTETPHPSHRKKQALPAVHPNSKPWRSDIDAWIIWNIWQVANPTVADLVEVEPEYRIYRDTAGFTHQPMYP
jgi:hypothetical protein